VRLNEERGITIGLVTHEPDMAGFVTRVVSFRDGKIVNETPGGRGVES
jgi:putative ABC transport system ATP-binding protein